MPAKGPGRDVAAPELAGLVDQASRGLIKALSEICDGAVTVDREARITWLQDKYRALLGIAAAIESVFAARK